MTPCRTMHWFRWHHGTVTDPKWTVIAARAGTTVANVLAMWSVALEVASQADTRGDLTAFCIEDVAALLQIDEEIVLAILVCMQGKVIAGERLSGWEKRQPKREDDSADRVKNHRAARNAVKRDVTQCNATKRSVTRRNARGEERRVEEKRRNTTTTTSADAAADADPQTDGVTWPSSWAFELSQQFLTHDVVISPTLCGSHFKPLRQTLPWNEAKRVVERMALSGDAKFGVPTLLRRLKDFRDATQLDPNRPLSLEELLA